MEGIDSTILSLGKALRFLSIPFTEDLFFDSLTSLTYLKLKCSVETKEVDDLLYKIKNVLHSKVKNLRVELYITSPNELIHYSDDDSVFSSALKIGIKIEFTSKNVQLFNVCRFLLFFLYLN